VRRPCVLGPSRVIPRNTPRTLHVKIKLERVPSERPWQEGFGVIAQPQKRARRDSSPLERKPASSSGGGGAKHTGRA